jgi:prevent-host-death family protein
MRDRKKKKRDSREREARGKQTQRTWQLQEAKAQFSQLVNETIEDGFQTITRNGHPVVVMISQKEFERFQKPKETIVDFFKRAPFPDLDLDIGRDKDTGREIDL